MLLMIGFEPTLLYTGYAFISSYFYCMDISQLFENVCVFNKRIKKL